MPTHSTPTPPNFKDLTGQRFGRLVVIERVPKPSHIKNSPGAFWLCRCDCGNEKTVLGSRLISGWTRSCGCLMRETTAKLNRTHGKRRTPEYDAWCHIISRCTNPNYIQYHLYGGRGIEMCDRWRHSFENFYADMGPRPSPKHSVDRIDRNGPYAPENCRWATVIEQQNNTSRNIFVTLDGVSHTVAEWARIYGVNPHPVYARLDDGWDAKRAFETPIMQQKSKK